MKNPNGYGSVSKLSGARRNPFVARKTRGWDERGYPVYETIGYFPTREAALMRLAEYNRNPWDIDGDKLTLADLYALWTEKKAHKLGVANRGALVAAYKHCKSLYSVKYRDLRAYQMQEIIDRCGRGYATQGAIKNLFGHLDRFALELDITVKSYSDLLTSEPIPETTKRPFTDDEVAALWAIQGEPWVDSVLIFLYTGFRISELLTVKRSDIDLAHGTIRGGTKTEAGKNRIVPIHTKIAPLIERRLREGQTYLMGGVCKTAYYQKWDEVMRRIGASHTVHECRHTFRSRLDSAGANKTCIDLIMGHKSLSVGERVYTHKTVQELKNAIELITS